MPTNLDGYWESAVVGWGVALPADRFMTLVCDERIDALLADGYEVVETEITFGLPRPRGLDECEECGKYFEIEAAD